MILKDIIWKENELFKPFKSLSPARISQKKNNFNESHFERGRNRKLSMLNKQAQQSKSAPDNGSLCALKRPLGTNGRILSKHYHKLSRYRVDDPLDEYSA